MTATVEQAEQHPSLIPGALEEQKSRVLADGSVIEFEFAPAGWLTKAGEPRFKDWRAYFYVTGCEDCTGGGRVPGKRDGTTKQCPACKGTGRPRRRYPSVTTQLDAVIPKPGIPVWAEARGIEGAIEAVRRGLIDPHDPASVARAVEEVRAARLGADRARDVAADRGLNVHACLEHYMLTGSPPNPVDHPVEHWGYLRGLTRFLLKTDPEPEAVEQLVVHPEHGYAGRLDLRARFPKLGIGLATVDAKTQERGGIYLGAHAQVNLYERAAVRCGDEPADRLFVVVFDADGEFRMMPADHPSEFADAALAWCAQARPVDSMCESANRAARKAREEATAA